jgi:PAS domain S-box-containing protein
MLDLLPKVGAQRLRDFHDEIGDEKIEFGVYTHLKKDGTSMKMEINGQKMTYAGKECMMVICNNVTEQIRKEQIEALEYRLMEKSIKADTQLETILREYLLGLESVFGDMELTLLWVKNKRLHNLSSPSLPKEYVKAINGAEIGPKVGSCGTSAFTKKTVIVENIAESKEWEDYRHLILPHGYNACWSQPIFDSNHDVIATFANYYKSVKSPTQNDLELLEKNASILSIILENCSRAKEVEVSNQRYEHVTRATFDAIWDFDMRASDVKWGSSYHKIFGEMDFPDLDDRKKVIARLHPEERKEIVADAAEALAGKSNNWTLEHRYLKSDGTYAHVLNRGVILRDKSGRPLRAIGAMRDVTTERAENRRLKLIESVITNTSDAVLITEADPIGKPGPRIIYANDAFEKVTGYSPKEMMGKTPRILQGPKTDQEELGRMRVALDNGEPFETTIVNYHKDGSEFWNNFSINPVKNNRGELTHFIAIERDVTVQKNQEIQKKLITEISEFFNQDLDLRSTVQMVMKHLVSSGHFNFAETWMMSEDKTHLALLTSYSADKQTKDFYKESSRIQKFDKGVGLPGTVWELSREVLWEGVDEKNEFVRKAAAKQAGLKQVLGVPLLTNGKLIGVVAFGSRQSNKELLSFKTIFSEIAKVLAGQLERKKLEEELSLLFRNSPDILSIAGPDGYFIRVNPAFCELLGYTEEDITSIPFTEFIHPDDLNLTVQEYDETISGERRAQGFVNRYRTKDGDYKWIAWNSSDLFKDEGYAFAYGRDVTEKKELEDLLENATELANLGFWELDVINDTLYWSPMVRKLHEVDEEFELSFDAALSFYDSNAKALIQRYVDAAITKEEDFSFELPITTAKGNEKWIKCIGKTESNDARVVRIVGSFQDIHQRKEAEVRLRNTADNFPGVIFKYYLYPDGTDELKFVSEGSRTIWQLSPEECMNSTEDVWSQIREAGDEKSLADSIIQSAESLTQWHHEWQNVSPDGKKRWHEGNGSPTKLSDGTIAWDSVIIDITDRKELEDLVERANKMARIGSWEYHLDERDGNMFWSSMTRKILEVDEGYDPKLSHGLEFFEASSRERIELASNRLVKHGEEFDLELLTNTAQGHPRWVRCIGEAERRNGRTFKIFGSLQDIHERKMAEQALRESEARLQGIMSSQTHYIIRTDLKGKYTFYNEKFYEDFGWTHQSEDLTGVSGMNSIKEYHHGRVESVVGKCISNPNTVFQVELDKPRNDGGTVTTLWDFICLLDSEGNPSEIQCSGVDISDRVEAERALQSMYNEKVDILESIGDSFFSVDQNWTVTYWNSRAEELLQTPRQAILNQNLWDVFEEARSMLFYEMYEKALSEQVTVNFDQYYPPNKSWFQVSAYPSKNGLAVYFKDITEKKESEEQLKLSNERFEKVAEATNDAIWDWDVQKGTLFWGNGFQDIFGYNVKEFEPTMENWLTHIHKRDQARVKKSFYKAVDDPNTRNWQMQYRFHRANGNVAYVEDRGVVIRNESGSATRVVGAMTDITERKEYEKSLRDLNASLEKQARELSISNAELEQFAYVASHDLQEPLRMVTSFLTQLEKRYGESLDDKAQKYIYFAVDGAKRMREIILDLLEFSRVGHYDSPFTKVDIAELINEVKALHRKAIEEKGAKIVMTTEMPEILGQRSPLLQVFQNLIGNSLKYSQKDTRPRIEISANKKGKEWLFAVKDNGIGISEDYHDKIFVIFQRLHGKDEFDGTGMGLAIVKKIVESFHGQIWLESEEGEGATFFFTLPNQKNRKNE